MTNFANFNSAAVWNGVNGNLTTVGSNGGSGTYGTYDQNGNVKEIITINASIFDQNVVYRGGGFDSSLIELDKTSRYVQPVGQEFNSLGFRLAASGTLNPSGWALINDIGNSGDITNSSYGSVAYPYWIGKYQVTNCEYAEFLNSVAKTDRYGLYNASMGSSVHGGILRGGNSGSYFYYLKNNMHNKPVVFVSWYDAARYANWLHNNKPVGFQDNTTTENGAYSLNGICAGYTVPKNNNAKFYIPDENEWYKAAYYKGDNNNPDYWTYATQSNFDQEPSETLAHSNGDGVFASPSLYDSWNTGCISSATTTTTTTTTSTTTSTTTTTTLQPSLEKCHNKQFSAIQLRRDSESNFLSRNPILASGEPSFATDSFLFKIGNGTTPWNDLKSPTLSGSKIIKPDLDFGATSDGEFITYNQSSNKWEPTPTLTFQEDKNLRIIANSGIGNIRINQFWSDNIEPPRLIFRRSRGTESAPEFVQANDALFAVRAEAINYNGDVSILGGLRMEVETPPSENFINPATRIFLRASSGGNNTNDKTLMLNSDGSLQNDGPFFAPSGNFSQGLTINGSGVATINYVDNILSLNDAMLFKGTLGVGGTITSLPSIYETGWTYKVITAGTYAGNICEVGDLVIAIVDRLSGGGTNSDWTVAQTNMDLQFLDDRYFTKLSGSQTLYVDGKRTDSYTETGTILHPFKTIQAAHDYATTITNGPPSTAWFTGQVVIRINAGNYAENLTVTRSNIHFVGAGGAKTRDVIINGRVTLNINENPVGTRDSNLVSFSNLIVLGSTNTTNTLFTAGGTASYLLFFAHMHLSNPSGFSGGSACKTFEVTNTSAAGIKIEVREMLLGQDWSSLVAMDFNNVSVADIDQLSATSLGTLMELKTTFASISNSKLETTGASGAVAIIRAISSFAGAPATLVLGNSLLSNGNTNGDGIYIGAGAVANVGQVAFNIGTALGTGFAVNGVTGATLISASNTFGVLPVSPFLTNNKVATAITNLSLGTSLTRNGVVLDTRTPTSHTHGNITNAGAIGSTANRPIITGAGGVLTSGSFGDTVNTFCQGNDSRLSDARTPLPHTHTSSQITNFDSSVSGLLPVKNIISGSGISVGSVSGIYTINAAIPAIINDPCNTEYILIQDAARDTKVISINNLAKAISVIDGGGVTYTGC